MKPKPKIKEFAPYVFLSASAEDYVYDLFVLVPVYGDQELTLVTIDYVKDYDIFNNKPSAGKNVTGILLRVVGERKEGDLREFKGYHRKLKPRDHFSNFDETDSNPVLIGVLAEGDAGLDTTIVIYEDKELDVVSVGTDMIANNVPYAFLEYVDDIGSRKYYPYVIVSSNNYLCVNNSGTLARNRNQSGVEAKILLRTPNHREPQTLFQYINIPLNDPNNPYPSDDDEEFMEIYLIDPSQAKTSIVDGKKKVKIRNKTAGDHPIGFLK